MSEDGKEQDALDRARAERDAVQQRAADRATQAREDEAQQIAREMDDSLDRAEAMGDRVEPSLRVGAHRRRRHLGGREGSLRAGQGAAAREDPGALHKPPGRRTGRGCGGPVPCPARVHAERRAAPFPGTRDAPPEVRLLTVSSGRARSNAGRVSEDGMRAEPSVLMAHPWRVRGE